jgi:hypothetical protein
VPRSGEIDHSLAPVQFLKHRRKAGIAGIFAVVIREQADAVGLQLVERVGDLAQAALDIRERQACEQPEAAGMLLPHLRGVIVALSRQAPRAFGIAKPEPRRRDRGDRLLDSIAVHRLDRMLWRPDRRLAGDQQRPDALVPDKPHVIRRQNMMVDVNSVGMHGEK